MKHNYLCIITFHQFLFAFLVWTFKNAHVASICGWYCIFIGQCWFTELARHLNTPHSLQRRLKGKWASSLKEMLRQSPESIWPRGITQRPGVTYSFCPKRDELTFQVLLISRPWLFWLPLNFVTSVTEDISSHNGFSDNDLSCHWILMIFGPWLHGHGGPEQCRRQKQ